MSDPKCGRVPVVMALEDQFRTGVVEYWYVAHGSDVPGITHHRATFHGFTRWTDHPWAGQARGQGADFTDEWAIEVEGPSGWYGTGRAGTDWMAQQVKRSDVFATRAEAVAYARKKAEDLIPALEERIDRIRQGLAELAGEPL